MANYTIKDLEKLSGIKAHTIRIWEKRYGLIEPERTSTNIRSYCDLDLKRLLNISMLNRNGFKISKIARLSQEEITDKINHLLQNSTDTESHVESLVLTMIDLDEDKFEKVLARSILQMGFENTIIKVVYPFFVRVGLMWQTGTIIPAQEHFVSNLIRQKLIVALDSQIDSDKENGQVYLLFLPEGELHELGLLFFAYILKKRGHKVIYLGQSVPVNDVEEILKLKKVNNIVTSFISTFNGQDIYKYIFNLALKFPDTGFILTGNQTGNINSNLPSNVSVVSSPLDFIHELDKVTV